MKPRGIDGAGELGLVIAAPSPKVTVRSDGEGVEMTSGDGGDMGRKVWYWSGLVGVGAHGHN